MQFHELRVGELFLLGFHGARVPAWLREFETRFGLGGVLLFDFDCRTRTYDNNVHSPAQVKELCAELASLPSRPLICVDQEGGKVRRLKEKLGFAPLPSQAELATLSEPERTQVLRTSFTELRELGFHYNLAPVVDQNLNPANPDIGAIGRSYSASLAEVRQLALEAARAARAVGLGLCLKHYPGLGGATVNSHEELTDISDSVDEDQVELFYELGATFPGEAILLSHGLVRQWDETLPVSLSPVAVGKLRARLPDVLLISDDMQMQGLQKRMGTADACEQALVAGLDLFCIGNNLMREEGAMAGVASRLERAIAERAELRECFAASVARVRARKDRWR